METHIAVFSESNMTNRLSKTKQTGTGMNTKRKNQRVSAPCVQQTPHQRTKTHRATLQRNTPPQIQQQQQQQHMHFFLLTLVDRVFHGRQA